MSRTLSPDTIARGTGRSWEDWLAYFDSIGAKDLSHQQIVEAASTMGAPPWWRQMVSVAYEQHIGRRAPGQDGEGDFAVSTSKTQPRTMDETLLRWIALVGERDESSGVAIVRGPETTSTAKWRYWRCGLADGSRVVVNISAKPPDKSVLSVQHEKLASSDLSKHWRDYWKTVLRDL